MNFTFTATLYLVGTEKPRDITPTGPTANIDK